MTILKALKGVKRNSVISERVYNAITLISKGYDTEDDMEELLEYSDVTNYDDIESAEDYYAN